MKVGVHRQTMTSTQLLYALQRRKPTVVFRILVSRVSSGIRLNIIVHSNWEIICRISKVRRGTQYSIDDMIRLFNSFPRPGLKSDRKSPSPPFQLYIGNVSLCKRHLTSRNVQHIAFGGHKRKPSDTFVIFPVYLETTMVVQVRLSKVVLISLNYRKRFHFKGRDMSTLRRGSSAHDWRRAVKFPKTVTKSTKSSINADVTSDMRADTQWLTKEIRYDRLRLLIWIASIEW